MTRLPINELPAFDAEAKPLGRAEFSRRFQTARPRLWLIAAAVLCDRAEADDIVQEAALVALRKLTDFTPGTQFDAWMAQITRNLALNARRTARRRSSAREALARSRERAPSRPAPASSADRDDALLSSLHTLDETARICLLLRVVGDLPYLAIARTLEIPEGTAQSHVHRARRRLHDALSAHHPTGGAS